MIVMKTEDLKKGMWVEYCDPNKPVEIGRVKSWNDKIVFVVFHANDDWSHYYNYTGSAVLIEDLELLKESNEDENGV
jgi:predicted ribosome quality control (RQC) complex YloA/Tae2 family protein